MTSTSPQPTLTAAALPVAVTPTEPGAVRRAPAPGSTPDAPPAAPGCGARSRRGLARRVAALAVAAHDARVPF